MSAACRSSNKLLASTPRVPELVAPEGCNWLGSTVCLCLPPASLAPSARGPASPRNEQSVRRGSPGRRTNRQNLSWVSRLPVPLVPQGLGPGLRQRSMKRGGRGCSAPPRELQPCSTPQELSQNLPAPWHGHCHPITAGSGTRAHALLSVFDRNVTETDFPLPLAGVFPLRLSSPFHPAPRSCHLSPSAGCYQGPRGWMEEGEITPSTS